jgi:signal-transduction protein with cAMP-binding, CBS, and nucleotidyltransferase domain
MFVRDLAEQTRARFRALEETSAVRLAADALANTHLGLIVICGSDELASGVVSKSDLVRHLAQGRHVDLPVSEVMTRTVITASPADDLHETWQYMVRQRLQNLPVVGSDRRPVGTLDIRDALSAILKIEERQEEALINYIAGNGYH